MGFVRSHRATPAGQGAFLIGGCHPYGYVYNESMTNKYFTADNHMMMKVTIKPSGEFVIMGEAVEVTDEMLVSMAEGNAPVGWSSSPY